MSCSSSTTGAMQSDCQRRPKELGPAEHAARDRRDQAWTTAVLSTLWADGPSRAQSTGLCLVTGRAGSVALGDSVSIAGSGVPVLYLILGF
jgi:hypothetical protein